MTDNEIIKALETCNSPYSDYKCVSCPLYDTESNCKTALTVVTLDLINRQKSEIETLYRCIESQERTLEAFREPYKEELETIKETAIKEFAERLKRNISFLELPNVVVRGHIDNLVKEMVEGVRTSD